MSFRTAAKSPDELILKCRKSLRLFLKAKQCRTRKGQMLERYLGPWQKRNNRPYDKRRPCLFLLPNRGLFGRKAKSQADQTRQITLVRWDPLGKILKIAEEGNRRRHVLLYCRFGSRDRIRDRNRFSVMQDCVAVMTATVEVRSVRVFTLDVYS